MIILTAVLCFVGCRSNKDASAKQNISHKSPLISFSDSIQASVDIIADDIDRFYEYITPLEMEIQMKRSEPFKNRDEAMLHFKKFIATEVSDWTQTEKELITGLFVDAKKMIDSISPKIYPDGIKLIKVKTKHYGNDVYYTRGKNIMIPENIFADFTAERQLPVMLHEIFHIYSRYNISKKDALYQLVGFNRTDKTVIIPEPFASRQLTNPDGVSRNHYITLTSEKGEEVKAIPLISSKFERFSGANPAFFDYLKFDLYEISVGSDNQLEIKLGNNMSTTIPLNKTPSFFTKIKDNTQYIIHPDEIMADNFMLAVLAFNKGDYKKFSSSGRILIDQVIEELKK
ncbi:MAG: hypothetical protein IPM42_00415 [Saprospiraceae bacterium]|nr:hypothetical protein [Saprospiraceae bacterium]